jgi:hypothetical protein
MPAVAGNHPGHQPGTTQARHVTGQGQLPCAHKGPNFVSVTTTPGNGGHSATHPDAEIPLNCGNPTQPDGIR